ncbi:response regulator [Paenibacillus sp. JX-17]|uniref:Response regulator n=1 Tax=Paenibacillus lacisoli TaxID=3064525 RepID=A0ABT9CC40_9BACL|nr:response regulator [Paenibacillus sp. JX-17]MDO7906829.1 response regulator [Paenibacillus sp. JX-17]
MNILIADDESVIRQGIKRTIEQAYPSYAIHLASSTEEAAAILQEQPVDIVLTDILMPGMDGLEFMRISKRKHPQMKWVVISAHSEFAYAQKAVKLGAKDYLLKPIGKKKLIECVETLADEARAERQRMKEGKLLQGSIGYLREAVFQRHALGLDTGKLDVTPFVENYPHFHLYMVQMEAERKKTHLEHFIIENVLSELIERSGLGFVVSLDRQSLLGLVKLNREDEAGGLEEELLSHLRRYIKVPFHVIRSGPHQDFGQVPEEVAKLRQAAAGQGNECVKSSGDKAIEVALQYIRAHYADDLSLEKVASVVFLTPVYFSQLFKQKTGQGYKEYVISLRMEQAKRLLLNSELKLADVAEQIGYQDVRHFTQVFRKKCSVTPTEYRQGKYGEVKK